MCYLTEAEFVSFLKAIRVKLMNDGVIILKENLNNEVDKNNKDTRKDIQVPGKNEGKSTVRCKTSFERIFKDAGYASSYYGSMHLKGEDGEELYPMAEYILIPF